MSSRVRDGLAPLGDAIGDALDRAGVIVEKLVPAGLNGHRFRSNR